MDTTRQNEQSSDDLDETQLRRLVADRVADWASDSQQPLPKARAEQMAPQLSQRVEQALQLLDAACRDGNPAYTQRANAADQMTQLDAPLPIRCPHCHLRNVRRLL